MESATLKRFWDSRLSSRFRDYDRRNNAVGYFRWSDNEPSARHKSDYKRAILLEDGKGHEVVLPKSGHQPFPDLDFENIAKEVREANDWTIDDEMMGKVYEGVIKVLHHDKPRCCKTEKLKQVGIPLFAGEQWLTQHTCTDFSEPSWCAQPSKRSQGSNETRPDIKTPL